MVSSHDSACSTFDEIHVAATDSIKTSPTSPEAFGLETKQLRDAVGGLRRWIHLRREKSSAQRLFLLERTVKLRTIPTNPTLLLRI